MKDPPSGAKERPVCEYKEAMVITGLKKTKLYDLFRRGVLLGYRDGVMIRFYRSSLLDYMKKRENTPAPLPPAPKPVRRSFRRPSGTQFKFL
ncbi:helix-turn-helix domain-containing protein [Fimbriiglobus ruber]|uniref:RNA polymerase sigma factor RpoD n=1 Tax=Fimbriiglobus ruber TaxID=1908690 RepID=A0A225DAD9_9BACT|nr:helix-turn-helix domain-containing protein [Fimbriiglobus ruber]OWK35508.1 RNA polymerase sigma factor RpoD [Fimbriiglobus ruber]